MAIIWLLLLISGLIALAAFFDFVMLLFSKDGDGLRKNGMFQAGAMVAVVLIPFLFLGINDMGNENDCCGDTAFLSPQHRGTVYLLIGLSAAVFTLSFFKQGIHPPLAEVVIQCVLMVGWVVNMLVAIQVDETGLVLLGNLSICCLFLSQLIRNHRKALHFFAEEIVTGQKGISGWCRRLLSSAIFIKYPLLLVICFPLLFVLMSILLLFGQQPDSAIRAFTDTYKQGLSQLDYMCDNVQCGGHYLCSVAANGHQQLVKPQRTGVRAGGKIICNRQLLVANAFEELVEEWLPGLHKMIRHNYNLVGKQIHRHYHLFEHKWISDLVYLLMKPLEWFFLFWLYLADRNPENRIAQQYLHPADREKLKQH